jgi:hypothetical protein
MGPASAGHVLIAWQGWSVTGSIAALLILLITILLWLLPFPSNPIADQLADPADSADLRGRLGAATPFQRFQTAMCRFNNWLRDWFGRRWSAQAFERCVAIAFVVPVGLFLLASVLSGYVAGQIGIGELLLFLFGAAIGSVAVRALFQFCYSFLRRRWHAIGGDRELADIFARIVLGAFAVVFAFAIAFTVASSLAGEASGVGTVAFAMLGGFAFALAFATAFAFAGIWAFVIALGLVTLLALTMAKEFAFYLLLFFVLLPILNALMDWLSWGVTRFNVSFIEIASPSVAGAAFITTVLIVNIAASIFLVIALAIILPLGLELADLLLSIFGRGSFDWRDAADQALKAPWTEGLLVTGMLLTPLIPSVTALTVGFAALAAPATPGARSAAEAIPAEGGSNDAELLRHVTRAVHVSWLWYLPALVMSLAMFALIWLALGQLEIPAGRFLHDLALCSTAWSHGQCAWL